MTPWMRKIHKWVGLLIGIQFVLWMTSGMMMNLLEADKVTGRQFRTKPTLPKPWPADTLPAANLLGAISSPVQSIATSWLLERPVYLLNSAEGITMFDAMTAHPLEVDAQLALKLASASYSGSGRPGIPRLLRSTGEIRNHPGPLWVIDFADTEDTSVYLSSATGAVIEHRNRTWRLYDVFWMLHIMDYTNRKDFNNPLVVTSGLGGLWLAITGIWLLITSFRLSEFVPSRWRSSHTLAVHAPGGAILRTLSSPADDTVFSAMARHGLQLPSNCGGGQSCGLCEVRLVRDAPPPSSADKSHLSTDKLNAGYRLACNLAMDRDHAVEVSDIDALGIEHHATVIAVRTIGPFLREIVLRPELEAGGNFRPGAFVQIHVPAYSIRVQEIAHTGLWADDWQRLRLPVRLTNDKQMRRSYSLSCPVDEADGNLSLLVRFMGARYSPNGITSGVGSIYMYSLRAGNQVAFSGPFGDFSLKETQREKVFIGGGAGMAPLRAMIRSLLKGGATEPIHFWYGARTLRDAPYADEMAALAVAHENFTWCLVLSDVPEQTYGVLSGLVHEMAHAIFLRDHPNLSACEFYLCGPPGMLLATRKLLTTLGVEDTMVAFDDFMV